MLVFVLFLKLCSFWFSDSRRPPPFPLFQARPCPETRRPQLLTDPYLRCSSSSCARNPSKLPSFRFPPRTWPRIRSAPLLRPPPQRQLLLLPRNDPSLQSAWVAENIPRPHLPAPLLNLFLHNFLQLRWLTPSSHSPSRGSILEPRLFFPHPPPQRLIRLP